VTLTFGSVLDDASTSLRAAAAELTAPPSPQQTGTLLSHLHDFFQTLRGYPDSVARIASRIPESHTLLGTQLANTRTHLTTAEAHLARAARRYEPTPVPTGAPVLHLQNAHTNLRLSHDLLASHLNPDGMPRSPYLHLLAGPEARNYVFLRITELARHTGELTSHLEKLSDDTDASIDLSMAHHAIHQSVIRNSHSAASTLWEFGELPLMTTASPANPATSTTNPAALDQVARYCDRIILDVFQAAHGDDQVLSGSDVKEIARSFALGHLLTGRTLIHLSEDQPAPVQESVRETANHLRDAAKQWEHLAQRFGRIVDVADPREHPPLPRYGYEHVRAGRANPMPRTTPHPATLTAQRASLAIGRLLFGEQWRPTSRAPRPRAAADITAEMGGLQNTVRGLHRLLTTAHYPADAGPHLLTHLRNRLVTDSPEHRPTGFANSLRWYPLPARQFDELSDAFHTVTSAAASASNALTSTARTLGTDIPRAHLDAAAHRAAPLDQLLRRRPPQMPGVNAPPFRDASHLREPQYRLPPTPHDRERSLQAAFERAHPPATQCRPPNTSAPGM
jgi:hypothetical protein